MEIRLLGIGAIFFDVFLEKLKLYSAKNLAALSLLALFLTPASAHSEQFDQVLAHPKRVLIVDRMSAPERASFVSFARQRIKREPSQNLLSLLCEIEPWSTGDANADEAFQTEIYDLVDQSTNPWDREFELIDCAGANREGSFFSVLPPLNRQMKDAFIDGNGKSWLIASAQIALSKIKGVDSDLIRALKRKPVRSFFPLVNVQRKAQIYAALAVEVASKDERKSQNYLLDAADAFEEWATDNPPYKRARNGWRYRNDMEFFQSFYRSLTGDLEALDKLKSMQNWPSVVDDEAISDIIPDRVKVAIYNNQSDYVDPIFFGRLLPGASLTAEGEADRWWGIEYPTREIVRKSVECLELHFASGFAERLLLVDSCISEYDPADWSVALSSFRGKETDLTVAEYERDRLLRNIYERAENEELEEYREDFRPIFENSYWIIRTEQIYSRKDIAKFREGLRKVRGNPQYVFSRSKVY